MDEFGGLAGMVTLRDIIEHLVGDLPSYDEEFKQEIVEREDGSWLVDGLLPISEFKDFLDLDELPLEVVAGSRDMPDIGNDETGHSIETRFFFQRQLIQMQRTNKQNNKAPAAGRGLILYRSCF